MKSRSAEDILDSLKIVMTELCYDDNNEFEANLNEYKINKYLE